MDKMGKAKAAHSLIESSGVASGEEREGITSQEAWAQEMSKWKSNRTKRTPTASAGLTRGARVQIVHSLINHPLLPRALRSIPPMPALSGQLAKTRSAPVATPHLQCEPLTRPRPCVASFPIAPTLIATSSTPACQSAAMDLTVRMRDASSHTLRPPANLTLV